MDAGPERPAEPPGPRHPLKVLTKWAMPPLVASELASRMVISRFCGSFPEPVSKIDVFEQLRKEFKVAAGVTR